jgi:hypothetical protein
MSEKDPTPVATDPAVQLKNWQDDIPRLQAENAEATRITGDDMNTIVGADPDSVEGIKPADLENAMNGHPQFAQTGGTWHVPSTPEIDAVIDQWLTTSKPGAEWLLTFKGRWKLCGEDDTREARFDVSHDKDEMMIARQHSTWQNHLRAFARDLLNTRANTQPEREVGELEEERGRAKEQFRRARINDLFNTYSDGSLLDSPHVPWDRCRDTILEAFDTAWNAALAAVKEEEGK